MLRKITTLLLSILFIVGIGFHGVKAGDTLASDSIKVTVHVGVMQEIEVIDPPAVEFEYPWDGASENEALIVEEAGTLKVKSNASWALKLQNSFAPNFEVFVRRHDNEKGEWKQVTGSRGNFYGESGSTKLKFDMKVLPSNTSTTSSAGSRVKIQLSTTLEQA